LSRDRETLGSAPISSFDELVAYFRTGEKPRDLWRVGTEHEKIGLRADDLLPVPYEGERGIGALLEGIAREDDWQRIHEGERLLALEKNGTAITLEPGGQLELSGAPLRTIFETCSEFHHHLDLIRRVSAPLSLVWLSLGIHPFHGLDAVPRMPRTRYDIMRSHLPSRGELALEMMHLTATVQANFDYADERDMARKLRTALAISPIVSAIFANSSLAAGKASGFVSRRVHIWRHTDPDRCGLLPFAFEPEFGYARYAEWALDVPMFFVLREGRYLPARGLTFRRFLAEGLAGHRATLDDWDRHLTTLFPEVRLKRVLEVRGADAVPPGLICALPALWKGVLYDDDALEAAWDIVRELRFEEREASLDAVARRGLTAEVGGVPVLDLARELVAIASVGLRRIGHGSDSRSDERGFLDPILEVLESGKSPGQVVLERWEGEWRRSPERLIAYARY
jgi:glutamate--cysteine ligase